MAFPEFLSKCKISNTVKVPSAGQSEGWFNYNHLFSRLFLCFLSTVELRAHGQRQKTRWGRSQCRQSWQRRRGRQIGSEVRTLWAMFPPFYCFLAPREGPQKVGYNAGGVFVPYRPPTSTPTPIPPGQWPKNMGRPFSVALSLTHSPPPTTPLQPHPSSLCLQLSS